MDSENNISKFEKESEDNYKEYMEAIEDIHKVLMFERNKVLNEDFAKINLKLDKKIGELSETPLALLKENNGKISKLIKSFSAKFKVDFSKIISPKGFENQEDTLKQLIINYLVRQGQFDVANVFSKEAKVQFPTQLRIQFLGLHRILEDIKLRRLDSAIEWAKANSTFLERKGSSLEFNLHKLNYISLLTSDSAMDAMFYAKANFPQFESTHYSEISRLFGLLSFRNSPHLSSYSDLVADHHWGDLQYSFTKDFCSVLGLSHESPLYISILAGTSAVPMLVKVTEVMQKAGTDWTDANELPVEIHLMDSMKFHSIFICPVLKVQTNEENPPMMLPCGHVICNQSLIKISKGGHRFKCPYCPTESSANQALRVYF